jgi:hypothetical protein
MVTAIELHEFFHRCAANRLDPKVEALREILRNPFKGIMLQRLMALLADDNEISREE